MATAINASGEIVGTLTLQALVLDGAAPNGLFSATQGLEVEVR